MRITRSYRDTKNVWETPETEVFFGRPEEKWPIVVDLSPDQRVSRLHGRIWEEDGLCWIEDLNSSRGTLLNGIDIKGRGKQQLRAEDVVVMLNDYLAVPVIFAHNGTVDKFIGDAILAAFGSPDPDPKQHENAIRAATEMQAAVTKLNEVRELRGASCRDFGIGVHCGEVVHGFAGTSDRIEFTVIGDAVNRTSRYCAAAAGGEVLISPEMHERVWGFAEAERTSIQTKHEDDFITYRVKRLKEGSGMAGTPSPASERVDGGASLGKEIPDKI